MATALEGEASAEVLPATRVHPTKGAIERAAAGCNAEANPDMYER